VRRFAADCFFAVDVLLPADFVAFVIFVAFVPERLFLTGSAAGIG
jgi:hypothetical protein